MKRKFIPIVVALGIGFGLGSITSVKTEANTNVVLASVEWVLAKITPLEQRVTDLENRLNNLQGTPTAQNPIQDHSSVVTTTLAPIRKGASTSYGTHFTAPANTVLKYYSTYTNSTTGDKWYIVRLSNGKLGTVLASQAIVYVNPITNFSKVLITKTTEVRKGASTSYQSFLTAQPNMTFQYHSTYTNSITGEKWYIVRLSDGRLGAVLSSHTEVMK
jgi:tetrahydromethanopterin S-methyltransferase subunit B